MKAIVVIGLCMFSFGTFAQTKTTEALGKESSKKETAKKETTKTEKPAVVFKEMKIERQNIPYDSKEPFVFEFKNQSKSPVIITDVHTSCGCTAAEKPTEPIAKGKSSKIVVNYDTKRVGPFTKTITVKTNASTEPIILTITGTVLPAPAAPAENAPATN